MQCEQRIWREGRSRECGQRVGIRTWTDVAGTIHAACAYHVAERLHRYPADDGLYAYLGPEPPEPKWLHEDPEYADDMTFAKWSEDREAWTEPELREAYGR
jgi:hypothetical protein